MRLVNNGDHVDIYGRIRGGMFRKLFRSHFFKATKLTATNPEEFELLVCIGDKIGVPVSVDYTKNGYERYSIDIASKELLTTLSKVE